MSSCQHCVDRAKLGLTNKSSWGLRARSSADRPLYEPGRLSLTSISMRSLRVVDSTAIKTHTRARWCSRSNSERSARVLLLLLLCLAVEVNDSLLFCIAFVADLARVNDV